MKINSDAQVDSKSHVRYTTHSQEPRASVLQRVDPRPFLFSSFSLPDVLSDPTDLIWRKGTPF